VVDAPESLSALVTSANTLEAFAEGLAGGGGGDPDDFIAMKGQLALPLKGKLLRAFNEADAANIRRPGMIIAASSEALVTTPWPATIRYAGPLLDYGNVMILEPAEGYLLVLAGLAQLFGGVGDVLSAGAPLGLMGGDATQTSTILALTGEESGSEHPETLYIELRVGDRPVDPVPWFRMDKD
jgi:septal ring factor EnvC (AmiA/AmiB activator)